MLSQYFIAITPHHPLMWYAIQHASAHILLTHDTLRVGAAYHTGPHALHEAFRSFRRDAGVNVDEARTGTTPVHAGHFVGTYNRTVTVVGVAANQNEYVDRDVVGRRKREEYKKMGMTFHLDDVRQAAGPGASCLKRIMDGYYHKSARSFLG
jgi:hypothetical protein